MKLDKKNALLYFVIVFLLQTIVTSAQAPYSIVVTPLDAEIEKDEGITYHVEISADPGFEDSIDISLEVTVLGVTQDFELGSSHAPYPQTFIKTVDIPEEVPPGVTIHEKILATSEDYVVEEVVEIKIKGGNIVTVILNIVSQVINSIIRTITNIF